MGIIYALIPLSILLALIALVAYVWAVRSGQFDDMDTPPLRVLYDEEDYSEELSDGKEEFEAEKA